MTAAISTVDHRMENDADSGAHPKRSLRRFGTGAAFQLMTPRDRDVPPQALPNSSCRWTGICRLR
jgi:hypothetical protein